MLARDIMTMHPSVVTENDTVQHATEVMRDRNVGVLPVVDSLRTRRLAGVITDRDILVRCFAQGHTGQCAVRDHMTSKHIEWVLPDTDAVELVARMKFFGVRRLPVVDPQRGVVGIVCVPDLALHLQLSEPRLAGEIEDLVLATAATAD